MSSPYLKIGLACALFATMAGLGFYTFMPVEPANDYHYNGLSQDVPPPPPPPAPMAPPPPPPPPAPIAPPPPPPPPPVIVEQEEFFKVVEEMPMFPGCDGSDTYEERKSCAQQKLMYYVYNSVEYPAEAKEKGKEGVAVVRFKVSAEGKVYGEEILRDPGAGMGEAALKTVRQMITDDIRWEPGRLSGKKVAVQFHLPVRFKLE